MASSINSPVSESSFFPDTTATDVSSTVISGTVTVIVPIEIPSNEISFSTGVFTAPGGVPSISTTIVVTTTKSPLSFPVSTVTVDPSPTTFVTSTTESPTSASSPTSTASVASGSISSTVGTSNDTSTPTPASGDIRTENTRTNHLVIGLPLVFLVAMPICVISFRYLFRRYWPNQYATMERLCPMPHILTKWKDTRQRNRQIRQRSVSDRNMDSFRQWMLQRSQLEKDRSRASGDMITASERITTLHVGQENPGFENEKHIGILTGDNDHRRKIHITEANDQSTLLGNHKRTLHKKASRSDASNTLSGSTLQDKKPITHQRMSTFEATINLTSSRSSISRSPTQQEKLDCPPGFSFSSPSSDTSSTGQWQNSDTAATGVSPMRAKHMATLAKQQRERFLQKESLRELHDCESEELEATRTEALQNNRCEWLVSRAT